MPTPDRPNPPSGRPRRGSGAAGRRDGGWGRGQADCGRGTRLVCISMGAHNSEGLACGSLEGRQSRLSLPSNTVHLPLDGVGRARRAWGSPGAWACGLFAVLDPGVASPGLARPLEVRFTRSWHSCGAAWRAARSTGLWGWNTAAPVPAAGLWNAARESHSRGATYRRAQRTRLASAPTPAQLHPPSQGLDLGPLVQSCQQYRVQDADR